MSPSGVSVYLKRSFWATLNQQIFPIPYVERIYVHTGDRARGVNHDFLPVINPALYRGENIVVDRSFDGPSFIPGAPEET